MMVQGIAEARPGPQAQSAPSAPRNRLPADLIVRQRRDSDTEGLFALLSQEDFQRNASTVDRFEAIEDVRTFLDGHGPGHLEIVADIGGTIAGFGALYLSAGRQAHVGTFTLSVGSGFQRRGIGTALLKTIVNAGWFLVGLDRIQATVFVDNARALALYRRLGFQVEGRIAKFARRDDGFVDAYLIALLRS